MSSLSRTWRTSRRCSPALLSGLADDAKTDADFGPGVAAGAQALDSLGCGGVDLLGQAEHEAQGVDVAVADAAAVGAQDAADECAVLVVSTRRRRRFGVNPALTVSGLGLPVPDTANDLPRDWGRGMLA